MTPAFDARGLIPAIAQDARTGRVLMLAWMSAESLRLTRETGEAWYFSRSRNALWRKGETSGHTQRVVEVRLDCDGDAVLLLVEQTGPACHTGEPSCFFHDPDGDATLGPPPAGMVDRLRDVIAARRNAGAGTSYTASLLQAGMPKILAKVHEESGELVQALREETDDRVVSEAADLLYHVLVGFEARGIDPQAVSLDLARRFGISGIAEKASRKATP